MDLEGQEEEKNIVCSCCLCLRIGVLLSWTSLPTCPRIQCKYNQAWRQAHTHAHLLTSMMMQLPSSSSYPSHPSCSANSPPLKGIHACTTHCIQGAKRPQAE